MALKFVPQGGGNAVSNETVLHESEDDDIEPDVDTSQESTSLTASVTCAPSSLTSTVTMSSTPAAAAAASASLSAPSQTTTLSSQLVTSQDSNSETKDVTSSEDGSLYKENISLEESLVMSPSPTTTTLDYTDCVTSSEMTTTSPKLVPSTVKCSSVSSTSHPPVADTTVTPADNHTTDNVEEVAVSNAPSSSSIALPDVTTPLDGVDDDVDAPTSSSASGDTVTMENDDNSCRRTPARHAKLNRVAYAEDKDEDKVTDNIY